MKALVNHQPSLTLAERVSAKLAKSGQVQPVGTGSPSQAGGRVLLLDCSGSMAEDAGDGRTKIEALREVARDIACPNMVAFSDSPFVVADPRNLFAGGNTMLGLALETVRQAGASHVALITDGLPTDPDRALRAAKGLRLDIFYVGPQPAPPFLAQLARAAATGSSSQSASLARHKELAQAVRGLLGSGR